MIFSVLGLKKGDVYVLNDKTAFYNDIELKKLGVKGEIGDDTEQLGFLVKEAMIDSDFVLVVKSDEML